jgi:peroxiredoxin
VNLHGSGVDSNATQHSVIATKGVAFQEAFSLYKSGLNRRLLKGVLFELDPLGIQMRFINSLFILFVLSLAIFGQRVRPAIDFSTAAMDGSRVELAALKGRVVMLTFWSTRCPICQAEIPRLNQMSRGYSQSDVVFLAATPDSEAKITPYLKQNPFGFQILPNSFDLLLKYADRDSQGNLNFGYPAYFVIDQQGQIAYQSSGWDKVKPIDSTIRRLISK